MIAEIIAIGSEMLTPYRQDTNSLYLTQGLNDLGVKVAFKTIVGDTRQHLTDAIHIALTRTDILILSGGLGPTEDDLTRECVAEALGLPLHKDPDTLAALYKRFADRGLAMPPNNQKQADVLDGAMLLPNPNGSAPGQWLDTELPGPNGSPQRKLVILLPGPPRELKPLFDDACKPRLAAALPASFMARRQLRMALIPESQVDARTAPLYKQYDDVETTILAGRGEIQLHFVCVKPTAQEAEARVDELVEKVRAEMGDNIFSLRGESLEQVVLHMLGRSRLTLAVAESCTGGLLSERLTSVEGASRVFHGGAVVYTNEQKVKLLDVPPELLQEQGAVSAEVARRLAENVRTRLGSELGLSLTGIAGPVVTEGPDAGKPAGLVYIGLADGQETVIREFHLPGDRDRVRLWATQQALEMLRRRLL